MNVDGDVDGYVDDGGYVGVANDVDVDVGVDVDVDVDVGVGSDGGGVVDRDVA